MLADRLISRQHQTTGMIPDSNDTYNELKVLHLSPSDEVRVFPVEPLTPDD
jgi:hypothetical protein